jgi:hypothetical protein
MHLSSTGGSKAPSPQGPGLWADVLVTLICHAPRLLLLLLLLLLQLRQALLLVAG